MNTEAIATVITAVFLGWAWLVARRSVDESNRRSAERRTEAERWRAQH